MCPFDNASETFDDDRNCSFFAFSLKIFLHLDNEVPVGRDNPIVSLYSVKCHVDSSVLYSLYKYRDNHGKSWMKNLDLFDVVDRWHRCYTAPKRSHEGWPLHTAHIMVVVWLKSVDSLPEEMNCRCTANLRVVAMTGVENRVTLLLPASPCMYMMADVERRVRNVGNNDLLSALLFLSRVILPAGYLAARVTHEQDGRDVC